MSYNKIGFLAGIGGNPTGIGDYVRACDMAEVPAVVFANDSTTGISDAMDLIEIGSTVPHVLAYRVVRSMDPYYAVPNYNLSPQNAAQDYYDRIEPLIPPEVKEFKDHIWILLGNELDANKSDWLGWWGLSSAMIWNSAGYKVGLVGFNSGEPKPEHWLTDGMLDLLGWAQNHRDTIAINVHEYSFNDKDIMDGYPWKVGRFQHMFKACDDNKLGRPSVLVGEWGWRQDVAPNPALAMQHIEYVSGLYAQYDTVLGAAIWTLQTWHSQIYNQVQKLIAPVTELSVNYTVPEFNHELIVSPQEPDHGSGKTNVFGIDVSHWQGEMDWGVAKDAGVKWAYIKAGEGNSNSNNNTDPRFQENWQGTKDNGIYRGMYHFYRAGLEPLSQAEHFADLLLDDWDLPPVADIEDSRNASATENEDIHKYLLRIEEVTGVKPVIYTRKGYWDTIVGATDWAKDYDLWVAHWGVSQPLLPVGWSDYVFWQYDVVSGASKYGAESEKIDVNIFNGTWEEFLNYINTEIPEPPDPDYCFDIDPFTSMVILHPQNPNDAQNKWVDDAMTTGVEVDGINRIIGFAGWSTFNAFKDILDAVNAGKTNSRLLILDGEQIDNGITEQWMKQNCPKLYQYTRWYESEEEPDPNNPLIGLQLGYMFDVPYVYTSYFNDPRNYGLHEGIDADVLDTGDSKANVYPVYPGIVERVVPESAGSGYGNYVRAKHEHNGSLFYTRYAHLDEIYVQLDQPVSTKTALGEIGNTGNSTGEHLHLNLEVPGFGLDGYVVEDVVDPKPYLPDPATLPVPVKKIDLKSYIIGDGRRYYLKNQDGSQQQIMQCQFDANQNRHYQVKGEQWESFVIDDNWIRRDTDTSPGGGRYYTQREDGIPARWLPRQMAEGEDFTVSLDVQFYHLLDCSESSANSGFVTDTRKLVRYYPSWVSIHGITLNDVVEIIWVNGGERYYYAKDYGLVGFQNSTIRFEISELVTDSNNNNRISGCFGG